MAWQCQKYNTLPEEGGLRDQVASDLEHMNILSAVYNAVSNWSNMFYGDSKSDMQRWLQRNSHDWEITQYWMELRDDNS